jgi:hypothetical protein
LNCSLVSCLPACLYISIVGKLEPPSGSRTEEYLPGYPASDYILSSLYSSTILELTILLFKLTVVNLGISSLAL